MTDELSFGKYRLLHRLAYGGMAEVFLARSSGAAGFEKTVVIKRLHPQFNLDHDFVTMLIDEAHIASQLTHTNICQVLDLGEVDGTYYLALEFIDGRDLFTIMRALRRGGDMLPIQAAVYIVNEVLEGLGFAHRKRGDDGRPFGIVHRDMSPQNVLITREGEVKIIDFGIAKARISSTKTQAGILKGKYRYMAPEQAEGRAIDQRTDLFSVGIVLYELLAGQVHGRGLSDMQLLERVRSAQFEPLRTLRPEVPPVLEEMVGRALERDPARRFQDALEFQDALSGFLHATGLEFAKRDLGALVRRLFPEGAPTGRPVDEHQTVQGTPSSRFPREAFQPAMTGAQHTTIEHEDQLEELADDDLVELSDGDPASRAPRGVFVQAPTVDHSSQRAALVTAPLAPVDRRPSRELAPEALPETAERRPPRELVAAESPPAPVPRRVERPARRRGAREVTRPPAGEPTEGASTTDRPLGLRVPEARPFEEPPAPPPAYTGPPAHAPPRTYAGPPADAPPPEHAPPEPETPRAARGRSAPRAAESPTREREPARARDPGGEPPGDAARRAGLSLGGKIAMAVTLLLLGGAAVGVLLFYNPSAYQPRRSGPPAELPTGSLYVTSKPAGAAISIDGKSTGRRTPDTVPDLPVNRGLKLELALDGYQPWVLEVSVSGDDPTPVMAELTREGGGRGAKPAPGRDPARRRGPP